MPILVLLLLGHVVDALGSEKTLTLMLTTNHVIIMVEPLVTLSLHSKISKPTTLGFLEPIT